MSSIFDAPSVTIAWEKKVANAILRKRLVRCLMPSETPRHAFVRPWARALVASPEAPRRLVFVCDRAESIDAVVPQLEAAIARLSPSLQAIRRYHSEDLDQAALVTRLSDRSWRHEPSRPTILVGSAHDLGSALLFSAPGETANQRPLLAGLLGCGSLWVVDRAHVQRRLLATLEAIQSTHGTDMCLWGVFPFHDDPDLPFDTEVDASADLAKALRRKRTLVLHTDKKPIWDRAVRLALDYHDTASKVIVFLREPHDVLRARDALCSKLERRAKTDCQHRVHMLTGTFRRSEYLGHRRRCRGFFAPGTPVGETHYLLATSAAEVGHELGADVVIADPVPLDDMVQRILRATSLPGKSAPEVHVLLRGNEDGEAAETISALRQLPGSDDARDAKSGRLMRLEARSPESQLRSPSIAQLDAWSFSGAPEAFLRPDPWPWIYDGGAPRTLLAWRDSMSLFQGDWRRSAYYRVLQAAPISPGEYLSVPTAWLVRALDGRSEAGRRTPAAVCDEHGTQVFRDISGLRFALSHKVVVLPSSVGFMAPDGSFDPEAREPVVDLAARAGTYLHFLVTRDGDQWAIRLLSDQNPVTKVSSRSEALAHIARQLDDDDGVRLKILDEIPLPGEEEALLVIAGPRKEALSWTALYDQTIEDHVKRVLDWAKDLFSRIAVPDEIVEQIYDAIKLHDVGKRAPCWQQAVGNKAARPLAKVAKRVFDLEINGGYAHEFGSVLETTPVAELARHLVAAHHGRSRPGFLPHEYDRRISQSRGDAVTLESMKRFVMVQREYGHWRLAYYEALLRAADVLASIYQENPE